MRILADTVSISARARAADGELQDQDRAASSSPTGSCTVAMPHGKNSASPIDEIREQLQARRPLHQREVTARILEIIAS